MRTGLLLLAAVLLAAGAVLAHGSGPGGPDAPTRDVQHAPVEGADLVAQPMLAGVARGPRVTPAVGIDEGGCVEPEAAPAPPLHLTVHVRHALTGADVHARWNVARREPSCAGPPPDDRPSPEELAARARAEEERARELEEERRAWRAAFVASGDAIVLPGEIATYRMLQLALELPAGLMTLHHPQVQIGVRVAAHAERYEIVVPVVHEAVLEVRVTGPTGQPAKGAQIPYVILARREWPVEVEELRPGVLRVSGFPHLPGEKIRVAVEAPGDGSSATEPPMEEPATDSEVEHATEIPPDRAAPWVLDVRLRAWTWMTICGEGDGDVDYDRPAEASNDADGGSVRLLLRDHEGRPIALTETRDGMETTDASGALLRHDVRAGLTQQVASLHGHLRLVGTVDVVAGGTVDLLLREPKGGRVEVEVVDGTGRPLPSALLWFAGTLWFDVVRGVQRLDAATDESGRRAFPRVQPGRTRLQAFWGGREARTEIDVVDGETTKVTLIAR
jgi:hypothetical protein